MTRYPVARLSPEPYVPGTSGHDGEETTAYNLSLREHPRYEGLYQLYRSAAEAVERSNGLITWFKHPGKTTPAMNS
jgi:hypothetical protein